MVGPSPAGSAAAQGIPVIRADGGPDIQKIRDHGIFDDINKSVVNKQYSNYALQINPETLEFTINPIDEITMTNDTYPLKDLIRPSSFAGGVSGNYEAVEQVVSKYLSYC